MCISGVCNPPDLQIVTNLIKAVEKGPSLTITIHVCGLMLHSLYSRSPQTTYIFKTHGSWAEGSKPLLIILVGVRNFQQFLKLSAHVEKAGSVLWRSRHCCRSSRRLAPAKNFATAIPILWQPFLIQHSLSWSQNSKVGIFTPNCSGMALVHDSFS